MTQTADILRNGEIPEDIMQAARDLVGDYLDISDRRNAQLAKFVAKAILAERQRDQWQPIETAPKDGTIILVALHEWNDPANRHVFEVVSWAGDCWSSEAYPIYPPTHWMPLPAAPKGGEA